jgi:4'-phosphopantetheinyl transferase
MPDVGWLTRTVADVPPHDRGLSEREREVLDTLRIAKRRADWRLGRWGSKEAVARWRGAAASQIEILAAHDGAPEAFVGGERVPVELSLSHRSRRAMVAVGNGSNAIGCDLEVVETRSAAFVREWLHPVERAWLAGVDPNLRDVAANLCWSAKEAASKARRKGLRLNLRQAAVEPDDMTGPPGPWKHFRLTWDEGGVERGWWRTEPGWLMTVLSDPPGGPPTELG